MPGGIDQQKKARRDADALFAKDGGAARKASRPDYHGAIVLQPSSALDAFVRMAKAENEFVYAEAPEPPRTEECWRRAAELANAGLVRTHHRRRAGGGWQFYLVRTGRALPRQQSPQQKVLNDRATAAIYTELKRCANMGAPCPSDVELADRARLNSRDSAQWRVRELVRVELITSTLVYDGGIRSRVVTIAPTHWAGASANKFTALPKKWAELRAAAARDGEGRPE